MMDRRKRFLGALLLFLVWVAALATLAAVSSRKPPERPAAQGHASRETHAGWFPG